MRKTRELRRGLPGILVLVLAIGIFWAFALTGYAAQGTVKAPKGAKLREEPAATSKLVGGAEKGKVLTILGQTQGADGYVWYQVQISDDKTGYIRSDLVDVTGEVPGGDGNGGGETPVPSPVEVTQVNPVSATVAVEAEIRDTAAYAGQSLTKVPVEAVLTVFGYAVDAEGYTWYQVSYSADGVQVDGFLPGDTCALAGELVPPGQEPPSAQQTPAPEPPRYQVLQQDGEWLLVDNQENAGQGYPIAELMSAVSSNEKLYRESEAKAKVQKIIIIVLVFLLVGAVAGIGFFVFKIRDMRDAVYFNEVEKEALRKRSASGGQSRPRTAVHTVGLERQDTRPAVQRQGASDGGRQAGISGRGTGAAPDQRASGSQRPAGQGVSRSASGMQDTARSASDMQSTARSASDMRGTARPVSGMQRTARSVPGMTGQRGPVQEGHPAGSSQAMGRSENTIYSEGARRPEDAKARPVQGGERPRPRNFMAKDDDFDIERLDLNDDGQ